MTKKNLTKPGRIVDSRDILALLPHRYPFLLIDRLEDINGTQSAVGIKNVTHSEPWYQGHFPEFPVMPGVFIIEAMAQTAAALAAVGGIANADDSLVYFMGIDKARFRRPVVPGDTLRLEVNRLYTRGRVWRFKGVARVKDKIVAEAEYMAAHYKKASLGSEP